MAGLTCALELERRGVEYILLEAADAAGGRVRTDSQDGFLLDRGFQVLLTGYPELRRICNYPTLNLRSLRSGAVIRDGKRWLSLPDPLKNPFELLEALRSPVGTLSDKIRLAWLSLASLGWREENRFRGHSQSTRQFLRGWGFSESMIRQFWAPFFGGVFLDEELATGSDLFCFLFPLFAWGRVAVPARGMQQIPLQIERRLTPQRLQLNRRVVRLEDRTCWDERGDRWQADQLVIALDGANAARLLPGVQAPPYHPRATHCSYYAAAQSIGGQGRIHLNAEPGQAIHHLVALSDSVPSYAPEGQTLISVSSLGATCPSDSQLRLALAEWFGTEVIEGWRLLRQYSIPEALPGYPAGQTGAELKLADGIWRCGDYLSYPSLNAAVGTGRRVAESLGYGAPT